MQACGTHHPEHTYVHNAWCRNSKLNLKKKVLSSETVVQQEEPKTCLPCFHDLEYKYCRGAGCCLLHMPGRESLRAAECSFSTSCISRAMLAGKQAVLPTPDGAFTHPSSHLSPVSLHHLEVLYLGLTHPSSRDDFSLQRGTRLQYVNTTDGISISARHT